MGKIPGSNVEISMTGPVLSVLVFLALPAPTVQISPRDELLRLVPDEVGFCLVLSNLRERHERLSQSPWLESAENTPLAKVLREAPELAKLARLDEPLRKSLGVTWAQLRDDIFGDAVVLAYQPGAEGKRELDRGVLLLHARNGELLARLLDRLNQEQKQAGQLKKLQERQHKGLKYFLRVEAKGESFYHLDGTLLVWTAQETLLRQVLDRRADARGEFKGLPILEQIRQAGSAKALATIWINPRALDSELEQEAQGLAEAEASSFQAFLRYWKALDGVSVSLLTDGQPEVVLGLHAQTAALPPAAQRLALQAGKPTELWERFPKDSLVTVASRADLTTMGEALSEFLGAERHKPLKERVRHGVGVPLNDTFLKEILPKFASDWGICVVALHDRAAPLQTLFALGLRPDASKQAADRSLMGVIQLVVGFAILDHNLKHKDTVQIQKEIQDGVEVHYLTGGKNMPHGVRPSLALKGGYLLLATSPEAMRRFGAPPEAPLPSEGGALLLRVSLQQVARLVKERPEQAPRLLGLDQGVPLERARALVTEMVGTLELFDSMEVSQFGSSGPITWAIRLRAALPKR